MDAYHIWVEVWLLYLVYVFCIMATKNKKITKTTVTTAGRFFVVVFVGSSSKRYRYELVSP